MLLIVLLFSVISVVISISGSLTQVYVDSSIPSTAGSGTASDPCPSIQCAIAVASDYATIFLSPGTYIGANNTNICSTEWNCSQTGLRLEGNGLSEDIVISCENEDDIRGLNIIDGTFAAIQNITIQKCLGNTLFTSSPLRSGGAVIIDNSTVTFKNMVFNNNIAYEGGAIYAFGNSSIMVSNSNFFQNDAYVQGGALCIVGSKALIDDSILKNNSANGLPTIQTFGRGGAIFFDGFRDYEVLVLRNNLINDNTANQAGGGVYMQSIALGRYTFQSIGNNYLTNAATGDGLCLSTPSCRVQGGGVYVNTLSALFGNDIFQENSVLSKNSAVEPSEGGGLCITNILQALTIKIQWAQATITSCQFIENSAGDYGGAIFSVNQRIVATNSLFQGNSAGLRGNLFSDSASTGGALWSASSFAANIVSDCTFIENIVYGGWGGAVYVTDTLEGFIIENSKFIDNSAKSSYTYASQGGALMASRGTKISVQSCLFSNNSASPRNDLVPLTYSGSGGALFIESSQVNISSSRFNLNLALTGQFDAGSAGGAVSIIDSVNCAINDTSFSNNGAAGYFGYSSYASSGFGGAIMTKFSTFSFIRCIFNGNWVSSGGLQLSVGGAVAVFYEPPSSMSGSTIKYSSFTNNSALSQTCTFTGFMSGQGGAMSIVGLSNQGLIIRKTNFTENVAYSSVHGVSTAFGGGLTVASNSNVTILGCRFVGNVVRRGSGSDIASIADSQIGGNTLLIVKSYFSGLLNSERQALNNRVDSLNIYICSLLRDFNSEDRRRLLNADTLDMNSFHKTFPLASKELVNSLYHKHAQEIRKREEFDRTRNKEQILETTITRENYQSIRIGILVTNGFTSIISPTFATSYTIFFGDITSLLVSEGGGNFYLPPCVGYIHGKISSQSADGEPLLKINVASAVVAVSNSPLGTYYLDELHLLNSTFYVSNNVSVLGNSSIVASSVSTLTNFDNKVFKSAQLGYLPSTSLATLTFLGEVVTGIGIDDSSSSLEILSDDIVISNARSYLPRIVLTNIVAMIKGQLKLSPVVDGSLTSGTHEFTITPVLEIILRNKALINVTSSGTLSLQCNTRVIADSENEIAIINSGLVELLGSTTNLGKFSSLSANSKLTVIGNYVQTFSGETFLYLNQTQETQPILNFSSNHTLLGSIRVAYLSPMPPYPELELYTSTPSTFEVAVFSTVGNNPTGKSVTITAPEGLSFATKAVRTAEYPYSWEQSVVLTSISCGQVLEYYYNVNEQSSTQYPCYVCLLNSSCSFCPETNKCYDTGTMSCSGALTESCCNSDCSSPNGVCESNSAHTSFSCSCNQWFIGDKCSELSLQTILLIAAAVFLICFSIITFLYYRYSKSQTVLVLEELRRNLLKNQGDGLTEGSKVVDPTYIRSVQQALILKDVFVKYDEIKLESQIGEGSFGVVYKASFRGAQVAVKQMRPVLMEITEAEIEEFRKEAYMMSRLRHPNIVLVMGISLVNQSAPHASKKLKPAEWTSDDDSNKFISPASDKSSTKKSLPQTICIVTEYLEQGSLADILYGPRRLPADVWTYDLILTCALQAARGMLYLHSHQPPICHRDLKSSNLVVDDHWVVKVTDFGMSRIVPEKVQDIQKGLAKDDGPIGNALRESISNSKLEYSGGHPIPEENDNTTSNQSASVLRSSIRGSIHNLEMTSNLGTTAWCAPELLAAGQKTHYSVKVDVYSFGMVLWELWERKRPFEEYSSRFDIVDAIRAGKRPAISEDCPPVYRSLIQRCWQAEPSRRPNFQYIVKHLKEEHATIRRQYNAQHSTSLSYISSFNKSIGRDSLNQPFNHDPERSSWGKSEKIAIPGSYADESIAGAIMRKFSFSNPFTSNNSNTSGGSPSNAEFVMPPWAQKPSHNQTANSEALPAGRSPLVASAMDSNLQQLAMTPVISTPGSLGFYSGRKKLPSGKSSEKSQEKEYEPPVVPPANETSIGSAVPLRSEYQPSRPNSSAWRDKFVMKQSGWKSTQPDEGLPPSLVAHSGIAVEKPRGVMSHSESAGYRGSRGYQSSTYSSPSLLMGQSPMADSGVTEDSPRSPYSHNGDQLARSADDRDIGLFQIENVSDSSSPVPPSTMSNISSITSASLKGASLSNNSTGANSDAN